ncbi:MULTISPECIES: hypothetical protein [Hoeflea]|uniref:Uncharacterized protein n=1 Tax=Hoeflea alexandrii TaxID=288436 RepID=A0ABT1CLP6_9HYPH|nr:MULTISPECIES: hypothetical protein [Hoeflea]MCO6407147.1 hypothetical protein [Hoeflea alexandrii]MCY0154427.1 hypothetical protein [Hoeflea alexandrii]VVT04686.1 conserved hypothetical protein [Hoeflea sp. EC-HK425]|tara:strand:- start:982 stop:1407 length:426 start_codon:yes stop_codon:yes gene_type:complete
MEIAYTQSWLKAAAGIVIGVGLLLAAGALPPLAAPVVFLADLIIWPLDGLQTLGAPETRVFMAISGGVMVGWGVTLWKLAEHLMAEHPAAVRSITMTGLYSWFVVDSIGSIAAGVPLNAVANVSFVVLFLLVFRRPRQAHA